MHRDSPQSRTSRAGVGVPGIALVAALVAASACADSLIPPPTPAPITLDAARSHADSERVGYFRDRAASRALVPGAVRRSTSATGTATVVSVSPGWVQGNIQRQPIVAVLSGNVNSVTVASGKVGDAIFCSGNYGTLIAYDANGA